MGQDAVFSSMPGEEDDPPAREGSCDKDIRGGPERSRDFVFDRVFETLDLVEAASADNPDGWC